MASLAELQTRIDQAVAALDAAAWADAVRHAQAALLIMAAIPDSTFDGNDSIRFDRIGAAQILNGVKRQASAGQAASHGGHVTTLVEYLRG